MDLEAGDDGDTAVVVRQGLLGLDSRTPGKVDHLPTQFLIKIIAAVADGTFSHQFLVSNLSFIKDYII